jgi:tetratricopeptide (TPR) repeat protein
VFGDSTHPSGVGAFRIAIWPASSRTNGFADVQGSPAGLNHGNSLPLLKGGGRDMRFSGLPVSVITCCAVVASMWVSPAIGKDVDRCLSGTGDQRIAACTRAIASGRLQGNDLAVKYMNRGVAYKDKGELDRATSDLDEAIRLNPNFADAYRNRGITYSDKGDFDHAIADLDEAVGIAPEFAGLYVGRGAIYGLKEDYDHAISDLNEAIRLDATLAPAYLFRGLAKLAKGDSAGGNADIAKAKQLDPNVEKWFTRPARIMRT